MKAKKTYKCTCCEETIATKGALDIEEIEIWAGYNPTTHKEEMFCSPECAARWNYDETDLEQYQEDNK